MQLFIAGHGRVATDDKLVLWSRPNFAGQAVNLFNWQEPQIELWELLTNNVGKNSICTFWYDNVLINLYIELI